MEYKGRRVVWDIEANGLLDATSIDYLSSPYKLKDSYVFHCIAAIDLDTKEVFTFVQGEIKEKWRDFVKECGELIAHNQINYDLLAMKLYLGMDYSIGDKSKGELDYVDGRPCKITDTLVISKTLNPDRYLGHGIEPWGKRLGLEKIDWRAKAIELGLIPADEPKGSGKEFAVYVPEMLEYNIRDVEVNILVYEALMKEWGTWKWDDAVNLEHMVAEIITRQSHRGFWFDKELAEANVIELDKRMEEIRQRVEPLIPRKPLGKTALKGYTPPATQFLKSGMPNAHIINFIARHKGKLEERGDKWVMIFDHGEFTLPCSEPIIRDEEAKLSSSAGDSTHLKGWLVGLGWKPSQYKERDLTCDSKKNKLSQEKYVAAVNKYVEQTLSSPFCKDRLDELETTRARLASKLLGHDIKRPMKVYTNPTITVGQEKEVDPKLLELMDVFPYAKDVSDYYSYTHRRNSILGGGVVMDELDEDEEPEKGFLSEPRLNIDGRIPTPADTCGAGTSRFKHKKVANIARITSIFGKEMRGLFGANREEGMLQLAYDFDSLEAKVEASYVYNYEGGVEYGVSLSANKPNDCHSVLARKITDLIGKAFPRGTAKAVKYGCFPVDSTEVLTPTGWKYFKDLNVGSKVYSMNTLSGETVEDEVSALWFYEQAELINFGHSRWSVECTEDHRWFGRTKFMNVSEGDSKFFTASDFQTNFAICTAGTYIGGSSNVSSEEAALVAWLLSDGYYKWSDKSNKVNRGIVGNIAQASHKFQNEVKEILRLNNMTWKETDLGSVNKNINISYRLQASQLRAFLDRVVGSRKQKHEVNWVEWVLGLSVKALESFLHNFWLADGNTTNMRATVIKQNRGNIADAVVVAGNMLGYKVTQTGGKCSVINIQRECHVGLQTSKVVPTRQADVFCITTGNGTFVIRQGGVVTVTGNCSYNAQPKRVAKTVGCDLSTGTVIFDAFWEQAKCLKELKEAMQKYWETTGEKKFLRGIDGRKLPIRSKGNVINTAFQSCGVICAKRAMVEHEYLLKQAGMYVDFFMDNWKNKEFCSQMIAYHDEAQLEISRALVSFKKFDTEQECLDFTPEDKLWSDPIHNNKGWFKAYCLAGELAVKAVGYAGDYYKLNVPLTAGYMIGTNWATCH